MVTGKWPVSRNGHRCTSWSQWICQLFSAERWLSKTLAWQSKFEVFSSIHAIVSFTNLRIKDARQCSIKGHTAVCLYPCVYMFACVCVRYKMSGELPLLSLRISDDKLRSVLELVDSIPLPESRPAAHGTAPPSTAKVRTVGWYLDGPKMRSLTTLCVDQMHYLEGITKSF